MILLGNASYTTPLNDLPLPEPALPDLPLPEPVLLDLAPNRSPPRLLGGSAGMRHEVGHEEVVLDPRALLHARGDVYPVRP